MSQPRGPHPDSMPSGTDSHPTTCREHDPATGLPPLRPRLVALLDEYDAAPRGTADAQLAAYVRGCLSSLTARHLRELPGLQQLRAAGEQAL